MFLLNVQFFHFLIYAPLFCSWNTKNPLIWRRVITLDLKIPHNWHTPGRLRRLSVRYLTQWTLITKNKYGLKGSCCNNHFYVYCCLIQKLYKLGWDEAKATGYQLNHEYIPLVTAKKTKSIVSDVSVPSNLMVL